jgi:hypothetical protein
VRGRTTEKIYAIDRSGQPLLFKKYDLPLKNDKEKCILPLKNDKVECDFPLKNDKDEV